MTRKFYKGLVIGLLLVAPFWVMVGWALSATYYVDTASAGGDGTTTATTGAQAAFATVAAAQAAITGDQSDNSLLFKRGCTWREMFTVGANGTSGHPFTIGAYGTGDDPVISGFDVQSSGWSNTGSTIDQRTFANMDGWGAGEGTVAASGGTANYTVAASNNNWMSKAATGTELWVYYTITVNSATFGDGGILTQNMLVDGAVANIACVRINTGGVIAGQYSNDAGAQVIETTGTYSTSVQFSILMRWKKSSGAGDNNGAFEIWKDGVQIYSKTDIDNDTVTPAYFLLGSYYPWNVTAADVSVGAIIISSFGVKPNLWSKALATETSVVTFDGTLGVGGSSIIDGPLSVGAIVSTNQWFWYGGRLYVYSAADPATAFTSPGVEAGQRNWSVFNNSTDYITIEDLDFTGANSNGLVVYDGALGAIVNRCNAYKNFGGLAADTSGATFNDCNVYGNFGNGLYATTSGTVTVNGGTSYDNWNDAYGGTGTTTLNLSKVKAYNNGSTHWTGAGDGATQHDTGVLNVSYSVFYGNWQSGIGVAEGGGGTAYNNVLYNNKNDGAPSVGIGIAVWNVDDVVTWTVKNNIIYGNNVDIQVTENGGTLTWTSDYNTFYTAGDLFQYKGTAYNFANYKAASSGDANSVNTDPLFTNAAGGDFTLLPTSPCIETGTDVSLTTDYDGTTVPQGVLPDIGAQEATIKFTAAQDQTYTSAVPDCTDADWDICLLIPTGATGVTFDRVTLVNPYTSGLALRADETLAEDAILNSIIMGGGTDLDLYVVTGKTAAGDHSAFPNTASAPDRYTDGGNSVWGEDPLFTDEATGDYCLTAGSPMIDAGTGTTADINSVAGAGNGKADAPTIAYPADEATGMTRLPTLTASAFAVTGGTDIGAYELVASTHTGSEWEICASGNNWASNVVDSGDDGLNLLSYLVGTPLGSLTAYDLRVRYKTDAGWSSWSGTIDFTTQGGGTKGSGRGGMGMQQH